MREVLIIGAGPAGLTAATYLGRFRRPTLVIDGGDSRARWIPESHNTPGFPEGVGGDVLLSRLRAQAERYGAEIRLGRVSNLRRIDDGFAAEIGGETLESRFVILATGVQDHHPDLSGAGEAVLRSLLRFCPICDAYEATDKRIAVIGDGERAENEAGFLRTYSESVTLIHLGDAEVSNPDGLQSQGIEVIRATLDKLIISEDALTLRQDTGPDRAFDVFYAALGCSPQNSLAASLGAELDESSALRVDPHQQTTVHRLYAAGDVVRGLNQIAVATADAAIAATDIHNRLRGAKM